MYLTTGAKHLNSHTHINSHSERELWLRSSLVAREDKVQERRTSSLSLARSHYLLFEYASTLVKWYDCMMRRLTHTQYTYNMCVCVCETVSVWVLTYDCASLAETKLSSKCGVGVIFQNVTRVLHYTNTPKYAHKHAHTHDIAFILPLCPSMSIQTPFPGPYAGLPFQNYHLLWSPRASPVV